MQNFSRFTTWIIRYNHKSWAQPNQLKGHRGLLQNSGNFFSLMVCVTQLLRGTSGQPIHFTVYLSPPGPKCLVAVGSPSGAGGSEHPKMLSWSASAFWSLCEPEAGVWMLCSRRGVMRADVLWSVRRLTGNTALKTLGSLGDSCLLDWLVVFFYIFNCDFKA